MKARLAVSALRNAVALRDPADTIVHSDRGSQVFGSPFVVNQDTPTAWVGRYLHR